ncbi:hypothetical protein V0R55_00620 [Pseudomonas soli]|uniref:AAA-like domain-containing protein n=1 Tax=Pseudomonas soli TaxID=1306993 RepID=A0ABU7GHX2_9PSED|nr:hypothetical protein [Pseudomonas soli]MEE1878647.1 hypothetical protein [Pseudomonas soli]
MMAGASGNTRQILAAAHAKIDSTAMGQAEELLVGLIKSAAREELSLVLPELREVIGRFFRKRKEKLSLLLDGKLNGVGTSHGESIAQVGRSSALDVSEYERRLNKLLNSHIFQWATYYRDTVGFVYKDLYDRLEREENWSESLSLVRKLFVEHALSISARGVAYSQQHGLSEEAVQYKSLGGLQQFLYLIMNLHVDSQEKILNSNQSRLHRNIASALLSGVLEGYAQTLGWEKMCSSYKQWVPALGFVTGADALSLMQKSEVTLTSLIGLFDTIVPVLLAIDGVCNKFNGDDYLITRVSRVYQTYSLGLGVTLFSVNGGVASEVSAVSFFSDEIAELVEVEQVVTGRSNVVVLKASPIVKSWIEQHDQSNFVDASKSVGMSEAAYDLSEIVRGELEKQIRFNADIEGDQVIRHNYATEFPLEDPDSRRLFTVERHSVRVLLERFEFGTGIHLWCSVRRSGKTTAATSLSGRSAVLFQTMDQVTDQSHHNIFEQRIKEALQASMPIPNDFFEKVTRECLVGAGIEKSNGKVIFLLDEYETLFGMLDAMASANPMIKFNVGLPLLSQMVRFASKNLLIFMGQSPDAYHIFPAQNQLSPLVKQHHFPLFEHHVGAADSEFGQFLKKVLTQNLQYTSSFIDAVYAETSGHPYLTVNLMVDFCDWLTINNVAAASSLDANRFDQFAKARLTLSVLSRSPYYPFFKYQFSGYLSDQTRKSELWLYAVARVLHQIGLKHPRALSCPIARYNELATQSLAGSTTTPQVLLVSGTRSNFLKHDDGHVKPAVRLMARLAACSTPEII